MLNIKYRGVNYKHRLQRYPVAASRDRGITVSILYIYSLNKYNKNEK